ncbi:unnamed protein product [Dicrocoelium dendriticum]|nr:unnamed protein product [Dicrocoelium dendriticum]
MWDLVINFLQTSDAGTYTCRLIGRTQQMIKYKVRVTEKKLLLINSWKKLVHIEAPSMIRLGYAFNLTCSVGVSHQNAPNVAVDWFRPEVSYDEVLVKNHSNAFGNNSALSRRNNSFPVHRFAQSFAQLVSKPELGIKVFKQLDVDRRLKYRSSVVFVANKAYTLNRGFYECRAYEPVNRGQERILDRAILYVVVHQPYPIRQSNTEEWSRNLAIMLAEHWKMQPEGRRMRADDHHTQNDAHARSKDGISSPFKNHTEFPIDLRGRGTLLRQRNSYPRDKPNTGNGMNYRRRLNKRFIHGLTFANFLTLFYTVT